MIRKEKTTDHGETELLVDTGCVLMCDPGYLNIIYEQIHGNTNDNIDNTCIEDYPLRRDVIKSKAEYAYGVGSLLFPKGHQGLGVLLSNANGTDIPVKVIREFTSNENEGLGIEIFIKIKEFKDEKENEEKKEKKDVK